MVNFDFKFRFFSKNLFVRDSCSGYLYSVEIPKSGLG